MSKAAEEIASQPERWALAANLAQEVTSALPSPGKRVAVVGCGSALNVAKVYAQLRERAGRGETDAFAASEVPTKRRYDHMVFVSRTGTTTETVEALRQAPAGVLTTAITASAATPLAEEADRLVLVDFADEEAVIETRFVTSVLVLLRVHLGEDPRRLVAAASDGIKFDLPEAATEAHQHTFLGRGWTVGLADEATLKLRETAQVWAESYPAMEYRHGPISMAEEGVLVWCFGIPPNHLEAEVRATGADWEASPIDPLADLIRAQRLALCLAEARGFDPDHPRGLRRSVVLDLEGTTEAGPR
jgi:fructoselysine-6-P-deglycase FrlB-like protein